MKIRLIRNYQTRSKGSILTTVPAARAERMIKNGIAIFVEEKNQKKKEE